MLQRTKLSSNRNELTDDVRMIQTYIGTKPTSRRSQCPQTIKGYQKTIKLYHTTDNRSKLKHANQTISFQQADFEKGILTTYLLTPNFINRALTLHITQKHKTIHFRSMLKDVII